MSERGTFDAARCEDLIARTLTSDDPAWKELVGFLWPELVRIVERNRGMRPLLKSPDHVRNVVLGVLEKLSKNDCRAVRLYPPWRSRNPDKTLQDWLRIVCSNVVRDYLREQLGVRGTPPVAEDGARGNKRLMHTLASLLPADDALGRRPPVTGTETARELLEFAKEHLPEDQCAALTAWIHGESFEEIADALGVGSAEKVNKLVRAAIASLRRHFAEP